jgi:hypothetical protein
MGHWHFKDAESAGDGVCLPPPPPSPCAQCMLSRSIATSLRRCSNCRPFLRLWWGGVGGGGGGSIIAPRNWAALVTMRAFAPLSKSPCISIQALGWAAFEAFLMPLRFFHFGDGDLGSPAPRPGSAALWQGSAVPRAPTPGSRTLGEGSSCRAAKLCLRKYFTMEGPPVAPAGVWGVLGSGKAWGLHTAAAAERRSERLSLQDNSTIPGRALEQKLQELSRAGRGCLLSFLTEAHLGRNWGKLNIRNLVLLQRSV